MLSRLGLILISFLLFSCGKNNLSSDGYAAKKLYMVHIHGEWCPTCTKIDPAVHAAEKYFEDREDIEYLEFDQTNPGTVEASKEVAEQKGLVDIFEYERHTGEVLYIDQASKKILTRFYAVAEKNIYIQAAEDLLKGDQVADIVAEKRDYHLLVPNLDKIKKAKLYLINIHHDMCGGCSIATPPFEALARKYINKDYVAFFTFDLSTREKIAASRKLAEEIGIVDIFDSQKHTGEVLFVSAKDKQILDTLVLEQDQAVYEKLIKSLKKRL